MGVSKFFGRMLGKNPASSDAAEETISTYDRYGREIRISKEEWRKKVLPANIEQAWSNADALYAIVARSLEDGFVEDVLKAAQRLYSLEKTSRAACVFGIALLKSRRADDAETLLLRHIDEQGPDGYVLSNLAKVYAERHDDARRDAALLQALQADPNQSNGLAWYVALQRERDGEKAADAALNELAGIPSSWRPQLWLARSALASKDLETAQAYYREALGRCAPPPADVLVDISGDLGKNGFFSEALALCAPHFEASRHGLAVGNNLLKLYVELRDAVRARAILEQLYKLQRADWKQQLVFWDEQITKLEVESNAQSDADPGVSFVALPVPMWAAVNSPLASLLPQKSSSSPTVLLLSGSVEVHPAQDRDQMQAYRERAGRLSRGFPLLLAEQLYIATSAQSRIALMRTRDGRFFVSPTPLHGDKPAGPKNFSGYIVTTDITVAPNALNVVLTLIRSTDGAALARVEHAVEPESWEGAEKMMNEFLAEVCARTEIEATAGQDLLELPDGAALPAYMRGLDQGAAILCAAMDSPIPFRVYADRDILDGMIALALHEPNNVRVRASLLVTLAYEAKRRRDIVDEYQTRVEQLQAEHPLRQPARDLADQLIRSKIFPPAY